MKKILGALAMVLGLALGAQAQNNVGINNATPHASAALDVISTSQGMLVPRVTTAQRTSGITNPAKGLLVYDSTLNAFYYHNGTAWSPVGGSTGPALQLFATSNAAQTNTPYAYNRYLFNFATVAGGASGSAWTNNNTYTVPAGMGGVYEISATLIVTAYTGFGNIFALPEIEVTRGTNRMYYYGTGVFNSLMQGDNTGGTAIGTTGPPYSYGRGTVQSVMTLQAGDLVRVYYRSSSNATATSYNLSFSTDGSSLVSITKVN